MNKLSLTSWCMISFLCATLLVIYFINGNEDSAHFVRQYVEDIEKKPPRGLEPMPMFRDSVELQVTVHGDPFKALEKTTTENFDEVNIHEAILAKARLLKVEEKGALIKLGDAVYFVVVGEQLFGGKAEVTNIEDGVVALRYLDSDGESQVVKVIDLRKMEKSLVER